MQETEGAIPKSTTRTLFSKFSHIKESHAALILENFMVAQLVIKLSLLTQS
jgi:hypothetical protein